MIERIKLLMHDTTMRQKIVALLMTLWILGLAVYGFIKSIMLWVVIFAAAVGVASLYGLCLFLWKLQAGKKQGEQRKAAAEFIYWFLTRNFGASTQGDSCAAKVGRPFKPLHGESDVLMNTTVSYNRFVTTVEVKLALVSMTSERDAVDRDTVLDWLRNDSPVYDSLHNLSGCNGFPRHYATDVDIVDNKLLVSLVVMDSFKAVRYAKDHMQAEIPDVSFDDDIFGSSSEDIPDDDDII